MAQTTLHHSKFEKKYSLLLCFFFLFFCKFSLFAQPVSFCISSATDNGNGVTIAITTENFTDIVSTQFTVEWNPNDLELISTGNFNSSINVNESNFTPPPISNPTGEMVFSWIDASLAGQTLPPGAILFSMTFAVNNISTQVDIGGIIEVTDSNSNFLSVEVKAGTVNATGGTINGNIFADNNSDCLFSSGETGLENWIIKFENSLNTFFSTSDVDGNFNAFIPLGNYTASIHEIHPYWEACTPTFNVDLTNAGIPVDLLVPVKPIIDCPALEINISSSTLERCSPNNIYTIEYCNLGTIASTDASIEITFDNYTTVTSSPVSFTPLGNNLYSFDIEDIEIGECISFDIVADISCEAPLGITHCANAHILPDNNCAPTDPLWSGASLKITGECNTTNDSVIFTIGYRRCHHASSSNSISSAS